MTAFKALKLIVGACAAVVLAGCSLPVAHSGEKTNAIDIEELLKVSFGDNAHRGPHQTVKYPGMEVTFNSSTHTPDFTAWELLGVETDGTQQREKKFYCDEAVEGCPQPYDYKYFGYDRGHICPAGDMKWSSEAMHASFSMCNISPQAKALNTGAWRHLEEKCRRWARRDSSLIIISGPVLTEAPLEVIGHDTRISVPQRYFKVILAPFAHPMRGIAFIMPNSAVPGGMQASAVSIDEVERITGLDFFAALPDEVENEVESKCEFHYWSTLK